MWSNYLSDYFPLFFFFIASPLSLLNLHHPSPYLHSPKPSYRSTHFSCPAPAHLFYHLPLFIFPQESQTLLVLSLSLFILSPFLYDISCLSLAVFAVGGVLGGFLIWLGSEVGFGVYVCVSAWVSEFMFQREGLRVGFCVCG